MNTAYQENGTSHLQARTGVELLESAVNTVNVVYHIQDSVKYRSAILSYFPALKTFTVSFEFSHFKSFVFLYANFTI